MHSVIKIKMKNIYIVTTFLILSLFITVSLSGNSVSAEEIIEEEKYEEIEEDSDNANQEDILTQIQRLIERVKYLKWRIEGIEMEDQITAGSYFVAKISSDEPIILLRKNDEKRYPLASITKLMTAVVAVENIDLNQKIVLTPPMLYSYGWSPSLYQGAQLTSLDLIKASLIQSTNDAADSLTYFLDKGTFLGLMNVKANEIGMKNSFFFDSHGLSPKNQSCTNDIVKLLQYIHEEHPDLLEITKEENFQLPNPQGKLLTFKNLNLFHEIPGFIGGKTGYLPEAKQTYTTLFEIEDSIYAVAILMSENRKTDLETIYNWLKKNPQLK